MSSWPIIASFAGDARIASGLAARETPAGWRVNRLIAKSETGYHDRKFYEVTLDGR
ncbi:MAG TPA: hypothetical protein VMT15_07525 [Bryobacteraceae bacterium]|nr:hypothetical protein [Bryobacteraceae bacterium]